MLRNREATADDPPETCGPVRADGRRRRRRPATSPPESGDPRIGAVAGARANAASATPAPGEGMPADFVYHPPGD